MSRPLKDWVGPAEMDASRPLEDIGGGRCQWGSVWGSVSDLLNFINFATFFPCRAIPASTLPGCSTT